MSNFSGWCNDEIGNLLTRGARPICNGLRWETKLRGFTGVSFQRSEVGIRHIGDGTSQTYLMGEHYLNPVDYETGLDGGDNETWCTGFNNDNYRSGFQAPLQDRPGVRNTVGFGSAHAAVFQMAYCDGHVDSVSYDVDPLIHRGTSNRDDGALDYDNFYNP